MLAGLFRSNQPAVLFAVPLLVLALFAPFFLQPVIPAVGLMPLAIGVERLLGPSSWGHHALALFLVTIIALQLAALINGLELMDRRNHLVAFLFPVILAASGVRTDLEPALLGMPFVVLALRRTWSMSNVGSVLGVLFDAGFLLGCAAMCFLPYAFLLVVVWATVSLVRPFAWREYLLPVAGLALVLYLTWAVLYLADSTPWRPMLSVSGSGINSMELRPDAVRAGAYLLMVMILFVAFAAFMRGYSRSVMQAKNLRASFSAFAFALGVIAVGLWLINGGFPAVLVSTPVAVFMGYALLTPRRPWLAELATWSLFGLALWVSWG